MIAQYLNSTRPAKHVLYFAGFLLLVSAIAAAAGVRYNHSESYPLGFWMVSGEYQAGSKGQMVLFCPGSETVFSEAKERGYLSDSFYCDSGIAPLIKKVVAVPGDQVVINQNGITINGGFVEGSQPFAKDGSGRDLPLAVTDAALANNQVIIFSDYHPLSFDSRYFGAVDSRQIKGVVSPVWTWEGSDNE